MVEKASTQQSGPSGPWLSCCSWRSNQFGDQTRWWQDVVEKASTQQRGPLGPRLSSPGKRERKVVMANRVRVNMSLFCSVSNSLSHATFQIKWEVYFSKNCVAHLYCVSYVDVYVLCVCIVGHGHGYTTVLFTPIDSTLAASTPPNQSRSDSNGYEGYSTFSLAPGLELRHQIV